jgi:xanthine/CO dehydrogenase XdhC/CoxF family maturation factor
MSVRRLIESFEGWRAAGQPVALATVYETLGSTYSKAGHRILVGVDGDYQGLVSGGCLEGDIAEHARRVLETGASQPLTYDLRDDGDDPFGLGVGCNGLIRLFLQPL